ncbi:hybrid sensor histidine kinase/response regulator [Stieleria varia]|uniref:histidine kinase n=1 Tax=Stieleria varia TaxID=2528005 RepID=A0A5C5ZKW0_9BACT|nr:hybrid sensor histidine kinase/response regulator [Stieleria varia]TWT88064.1 Gliding motility regulatory protein [Stieleria varia]
MSNQTTGSGNAFSDHAFELSGRTTPKSLAVQFADSMEMLADLQQAGLEDISDNLVDFVTLLSSFAGNVNELVANFDDDDASVQEQMRFVISACDQIREIVVGDDSDGFDWDQIDALRDEITMRMESEHENAEERHSDSEIAAPSADEIAKLLSQLGDVTPLCEPVPKTETALQTLGKPAQSQSNNSTDSHSSTTVEPPALDNVELDEELREAFMDDASRGLAAMEQALLQLESDPTAADPIRVIQRELHTIKGASASVGMEHLARYIHDVEEFIREKQDAGNPVDQQELFHHVDVIRCRVEGQPLPAETTSVPQQPPAQCTTWDTSAPHTAQSSPQPLPQPTPQPVAKASAASPADDHGDDETVRVKSSQLNRLMDMLSELVMLRNQRDTELRDLKQIHGELTYCVTRMRMLSHEGESLLAMDKLADAELAGEGISFSRLNEVASDVMESAQRLRECYQPVADGNQAVSEFIRNFRLELTQLRRTPVAGLFRRLHRAISDAARSEGKQIRVELIGENTGIERSLQERIFEPLLHIVRNCVGHGIETSEKRIAKGKSPHGTVTLHAHSGPDLLVIEVRDDGSGLDFDAIRRRGIERGLIGAENSASRAELAQLIFHPGFSTRQTVDQLSGRGVGMDVVASTLERMRGWVEVDSESGQGTTIRLSLPLPSMIQHVMVFRAAGQLFAFPVTAIAQAGNADAYERAVPIHDILNLTAPASPTSDHSTIANDSAAGVIELFTTSASGDPKAGNRIALLVDQVLGPEEIVVRPLPTLLKPHPFCCGATLSGMGEVVLLLDPRRFAVAAGSASTVPRVKRPIQESDLRNEVKVLVVDDSKSARLRVVQALQRYGVMIDQFEDGQAAWEALVDGSYDAVFSDIDMPRMTGLELLESIKQHESLQQTPVFMISSRSVETAGKHAIQLGASAYIQKPLLDNRLADAVANLSWAKP